MIAKNKSFFHAMATHFDTFFNPPFHGKVDCPSCLRISFTCSGLAFFSLFRSLYSLMVLDFSKNQESRIAQEVL
jgi:hypothetical protein